MVLAGSIVAQMVRWNALGEAMEVAVRSEQQPRMPFRRAGYIGAEIQGMGRKNRWKW